MQSINQPVRLDPTIPVYLHFGDIELGEYLRSGPIHSHSLNALAGLVIASASLLYSGYSLVWQLSPDSVFSKTLKYLYDRGQYIPYTVFADPDSFRLSRTILYDKIREQHSFYFGHQGEVVARMFESPALKYYPTAATIARSLESWANDRIFSNENDRIGTIVRRTLDARREEALTIDLFARTMNLDKSENDIRAIHLNMLHGYIRVYLKELGGAISTGLPGCGQIDLISPYCPQYDYCILSYVVNVLFGNDVMHRPARYLSDAAGFRGSAAHVAFCESLVDLLHDIVQSTFQYDDQDAITVEFLRRKIVSRIRFCLRPATDEPRDLSETGYLRAGEAVQEARLRFAERFAGQLALPQKRFVVTVSAGASAGAGALYVASEQRAMIPEHKCDIGIITVTDLELQAVQDALGCDNINDRMIIKGSLYWKASISSCVRDRDISIIIHCTGRAGEDTATAAAERFINNVELRLLILVGTAAGRRGKCKIGDVVIPRVVVDHSLRVAEGGQQRLRPSIPELPYPLTQMIASWRLDRQRWHRRFQCLCELQAVSEPRVDGELDQNISPVPDLHQAAIASGNILLRDESELENIANHVHENTYIGEMEAGGFVRACQMRRHPIPWFIVRGVSDFGGSARSDSWRKRASCAAAAYLACFLQDGVDLDLI